MSDDKALTTMPPEMQAQYDRFIGEWNRKVISIPEIKVSYDDDSKGEYVMKNGDETKVLGGEIKGVILKVRNQYSMYADDKEEAIKTNEFDGFDEIVTLYKGGKVVKSGPYQEIKAIIKEEYPEAKYVNVMYFLYEGTVHRIYSKPASRQNLWDYQAKTSGKAPFAFETTLTTKKNKNGNITYYSMEFEKGDDVDSKSLQENIKLRLEIDRTLKQLEMAHGSSGTSAKAEPKESSSLPEGESDDLSFLD